MDNWDHQHTRMVTHIVTPITTNFTPAEFQPTPPRTPTSTTRQQSPHAAVQPFIKTGDSNA